MTESRGVVARFYIESTTRSAYNPDHVEVTLKAAGRGEQNKSWAQYTPSGEMKLTINNPAAAAFFVDRLGQDVELRFTALEDGTYASEHSSVPIPAA